MLFRSGATVRRDHGRSSHRVGEVDGNKPFRDGLFGPMSDAPQVMRIFQTHDAHAVSLGPRDCDIHGLKRDRLAHASFTIDGEQTARVGDQLDLLVELEFIVQERLNVTRQHADAMRVVAGQVGADEVIGSVEETLRVIQALQTGGLCQAEWRPGQETLKP